LQSDYVTHLWRWVEPGLQSKSGSEERAMVGMVCKWTVCCQWRLSILMTSSTSATEVLVVKDCSGRERGGGYEAKIDIRRFSKGVNVILE